MAAPLWLPLALAMADKGGYGPEARELVAWLATPEGQADARDLAHWLLTYCRDRIPEGIASRLEQFSDGHPDAPRHRPHAVPPQGL